MRRSGGGGKVTGGGGGKVLLGMTCQVDHFGSIEEDISTCRSIDCCRNVANTVFHYFLDL